MVPDHVPSCRQILTLLPEIIIYPKSQVYVIVSWYLKPVTVRAALRGWWGSPQLTPTSITQILISRPSTCTSLMVK